MNSLKYIKTAVLASAVMFSLSSCVKDDDFKVPEVACNNRFDAANHSLADIKTIAVQSPTAANIISEDYIVEAYVTSSDETGNIYKAMYLQDQPENPTIGIEMDIDGSNQYADFPVGAMVRINLKGLIVQQSNGNYKVGTFDPAYPIGRINPNKLPNYMARVCNGNKPVKATIVPVEFNSIAAALRNGDHINQLVKINNVQFNDPELTKTFADPDKTADRYIVDKNGTTLDLRFSNYASFAKSPISPTYAGSGSIILNLSRYTSNPTNPNFTEQAYIRFLSDMDFPNPRFTPGVPDAPSASAVNLFNGSDFENWANFLSSINSFGLKSYATQGIGNGYNGGNSLQIIGTPTGNDYVFTSFATTGLPANPKRITFYVKGTAASKSMSFNVYKDSDNSKYYCFNLGTFTKGAILEAVDTNQYTGSINTSGEWKLVELSLAGLPDLALTPGKQVFALKVGKDSAFNLLIDQIKIE